MYRQQECYKPRAAEFVAQFIAYVPLHSKQIKLKFSVSVFLCPKVEWDRSKFVNKRYREAILSQIDRLDICLAGIAALDANVRKAIGGINGKLSMILLAASGTNHAAELPLSQAESAKQIAPASIALLAQDSKRRFAIAERA